MYLTPVIGITCFAIIMASWFGGVRYPMGIPAGLVAIVVGIAHRLGLEHLRAALRRHEPVAGVCRPRCTASAFRVPLPAVGTRVLAASSSSASILVTAIPFGIYDLVEAMDNVESAEAAGDAYPTTRVLTADGVFSLHRLR